MKVLNLRSFAAVVALTMVGSAPALAELESQLEAFVVTTDSSGTDVYAEATTVKPGQTIEYRLLHTNTFEHAIGGVSVIGPVPEGGELISETLTSDASASFEVRGDFDPDQDGEEWSSLPAMQIVVQEDGTRSYEEADPATFTAVRWNFSEPLQQNASVSNAYRVQVK